MRTSTGEAETPEPGGGRGPLSPVAPTTQACFDYGPQPVPTKTAAAMLATAIKKNWIRYRMIYTSLHGVPWWSCPSWS